jgi:hypothetical protein
MKIHRLLTSNSAAIVLLPTVDALAQARLSFFRLSSRRTNLVCAGESQSAGEAETEALVNRRNVRC